MPNVSHPIPAPSRDFEQEIAQHGAIIDNVTEMRPPAGTPNNTLHLVRIHGAVRMWAWCHGSWWPARVGDQYCMLPHQAAHMKAVWLAQVDIVMQGDSVVTCMLHQPGDKYKPADIGVFNPLYAEHKKEIEELAEAMASQLNPGIVDKHDLMNEAISAFSVYWEKKGCWPPDRSVTALHRIHIVPIGDVVITWSAKRQAWYDAVHKRYWTPQEVNGGYIGPEE